jgi:hypothetical protein
MDWLIMQYSYGLYERKLKFKVPQNKEVLVNKFQRRSSTMDSATQYVNF